MLQDPYGEFMVVEDRSQTKETLEEDFNARCAGAANGAVCLLPGDS